MKSIKKGDNGERVKELQQLLINAGLSLTADGDFGSFTKAKVQEFQRNNGLVDDGIVGASTWAALNGGSVAVAPKPGFNAGIRNYPLSSREYMKDVYTKKTIYLHHTAGGPRPDYTIEWWMKDGNKNTGKPRSCLLYTSPSPRDATLSRMPSSA